MHVSHRVKPSESLINIIKLDVLDIYQIITIFGVFSLLVRFGEHFFSVCELLVPTNSF